MNLKFILQKLIHLKYRTSLLLPETFSICNHHYYYQMITWFNYQKTRKEKRKKKLKPPVKRSKSHMSLIIKFLSSNFFYFPFSQKRYPKQNKMVYFPFLITPIFSFHNFFFSILQASLQNNFDSFIRTQEKKEDIFFKIIFYGSMAFTISISHLFANDID